LSQRFAELIQALCPQQERLTAMQHDGEGSRLSVPRFSETLYDRANPTVTDECRASTPTVIPCIVDIAVGTVEIAPTRDLEKDRVEGGL
jgi:hypothetical protein